MTGHTKEPWLLSGLTVYTLRPCKWLGEDSLENAWSATVQPDGKHQTSTPELEANARRIVDCVNAMQGIPDPAAYVAAMGKVVKAAQEQLDYMDLCNDKGDLERNLRTALATFRAQIGDQP